MPTTDPEKLRAQARRKYERQKLSGVYQAKARRKYERQKLSGVYQAKARRKYERQKASGALAAKYERQKASGALAAKYERKAMARPFIAWDGEGITLPTGEHIYTLLRNSTGTEIRGPGLKTRDCVNFILHTAFLNPGAIHVAYAFDYDINMILADVCREQLQAIHDYDGNAGVYTPDARAVINYRPHKMTRFSKTIGGKRYSCTIYDLFTFEHRSFVKACDRYLGADWPHRAEVIAGKEGRATFGADDIEMMSTYCGYELDAMVLFADELRSRLNDAGLRPKTWNGPGAVASVVLQKHKIKEHLPDNAAPYTVALRGSATPLDTAMQYAYSGGRFELFRYGVKQGPVWRYDLHSAYPWAMTLLPSLARGRWHYKQGLEVQHIAPNSLYHVYWRSHQTDGSRPQPFHHRHPNGNVCYPYETEGWYWAPEVEMALDYMRQYGFGECSIKEAYIFEPNEPVYPAPLVRPFAFMQEYYDERAKLKAAGHPAELAYKLAINSVYGKLIQQLGWSRRDNTAPTWFCLQWGGLITSYTRAALMRGLMDNQALDDVISFETDAIFSRKRLTNLDIGPGLGQWDEVELSELTYLQSGFYAGQYAGGEVFGKTRGRTADAVNAVDPERFRDEIGSCIVERRPYKYTLHGFVGMGRALQTNFDEWRTWIDIPREIEPPDVLVETTSKRVHDIMYCTCEVEEISSPYEQQIPMGRQWHTTFVPPILSAGPQRPYEIAWEGRIMRDELWETF
jgi:hypothetical protein